MTTERFEQLCKAITDNTATPLNRMELVKHVIQLRCSVIDSIGRSDTWDQEEPLLDYDPYPDEEGDEHPSDEHVDWMKRHGWN
jgi:hypothetical protein